MGIYKEFVENQALLFSKWLIHGPIVLATRRACFGDVLKTFWLTKCFWSMLFFFFKTENPCVLTIFITFLEILFCRVQILFKRDECQLFVAVYIVQGTSKKVFIVFRKIIINTSKN